MSAGTPTDDPAAIIVASGASSELERRVMAAVKASEARGDPPLLRAVEAGRCCASEQNGLGLGFPNPDLAMVLVSNLCFSHNTPSMWKLVDQAMASRFVYPLHALALLSPRVIPHRRMQPEAYRLYLELTKRYSLSSPSLEAGACRDKITKSIDDALQLSQTYGVDKMDFGTAVVLFVLSVITGLIDCTLEDCGLPFVSTDRHGNLHTNDGPQSMEIDVKEGSNNKRPEHREQLRRGNTFLALEVLEKMTANKKIQVCLRLIQLNMPEKFNGLLQRLRFIEAHKLASKSLASANHVLETLFSNVQKAVNAEYVLNKRQLLGLLVDTGLCSSTLCPLTGAGKSGCWISYDVFMENAMDGKTLCPISACEILSGLTKTLQIINQASWQETFQALWISALRLVQRERELVEGPVPHLDSRLCMLLAIIPLSIAALLKEESEIIGTDGNTIPQRRQGLVSCLQSLAHFSGLLSPPVLVVTAANSAATKAAQFITNFKTGGGNLGIISRNDSSTKAVGSMLHLIVEACIARNLIDTSAYFWPGYVVQSVAPKEPNSMLIQDSPWSNFMQGAPLTGSLQSALVANPASSVAELEKLYHMALNGSEEERSAASKILCGASLIRGWNIQEHVVQILVKLLSPPPSDSSVTGTTSHYLGHTSMLNAILSGLSYGDAVHILSLYGVVPDVAAALMPICEAFGSVPPSSNHRSSTGEETSVYSVFSFAFLFLLRLWKFYVPPQEHCILGRGGQVRPELTLDYLLLLRNNRLPFDPNLAGNGAQPVYIDSFPKLRAWHFQNQACIASTLSGLSSKNPVHQSANMILNMIFRKMNKGGGGVVGSGNLSSTSSGGSMSGSSVSTGDDLNQRPALPAWELLEAVPFVLEALLTACAYGRLSSRDLTTGLRDLVDFFPASLAAIVSYFSAEITRGIWKTVSMNGTEWPSPAASLHSVESEVKEVLASAGVHIQSCYPRGMPPMLPLPMAALVSLTITFKLDKNLEYIRGVVGQALENCAVGSAWPSMPIIGALWTQKARRWHDFIILSCTRSPFSRDQDAVAQLIHSCFSSFLGPPSTDGSYITSTRGVVGLLGQTLSNQAIRPGFLYLRTCRTFHDTHFVSEVIFKLVIKWACRLADEWASSGPARLKSGRVSLASAACAVRQVAILGSSLLCIAGRALLVQVLFEETLPTVLISAHEKSGSAGPVSSILEGYAMSYMLFFSAAIVWGIVGCTAPCKLGYLERRARVIGTHMDFMAGVLDGNIVLGCDPATWKAYVSCFVGLVVRFAPSWVPSVKINTLRKLASGLRGWHECDLALSLLELGGPGAMEAVVESVF